MPRLASCHSALKLALAFLAILASGQYLFAPIVGSAIPLAKIIEQSDVIIKAKAISSVPVSDNWFESWPGFQVCTTRMQVISVIKGSLSSAQVEFHLDALCNIVDNRLKPRRWDGKIPYAASWNILFAFLQTQTQESLQSGQFDKELTALEKAEIFSSSKPRDLYDFYLKNQMKERAVKFREYVGRTSKMNLEYFFNQVDLKYRVAKHSVGT